MEPEYDYIFKCILLGSSGSGKSSILLQYTEGLFTTSHISTIGVDFKLSTIRFNNKIIKLQLWDTAGQERFKAIVSSYYRGGNIFIIVYDVTSFESYGAVNDYLQDIKRYAACTNPTFVLVGNKCDLTSKKVIDYETAKMFADQNGLLFAETSAKTNYGIKETIENAVFHYFEKNNFDKLSNSKKNAAIVPKWEPVKKNLCC